MFIWCLKLFLNWINDFFKKKRNILVIDKNIKEMNDGWRLLIFGCVKLKNGLRIGVSKGY